MGSCCPALYTINKGLIAVSAQATYLIGALCCRAWACLKGVHRGRLLLKQESWRNLPSWTANDCGCAVQWWASLATSLCYFDFSLTIYSTNTQAISKGTGRYSSSRLHDFCQPLYLPAVLFWGSGRGGKLMPCWEVVGGLWFDVNMRRQAAWWDESVQSLLLWHGDSLLLCLFVQVHFRCYIHWSCISFN